MKKDSLNQTSWLRFFTRPLAGLDWHICKTMADSIELFILDASVGLLAVCWNFKRSCKDPI